MIDFLDSNNFKWTSKKISSYEKWKENSKKGIIDFIEDDDYEEFEKRFLKEMEIQEEQQQEEQQQEETSLEEKTVDMNIKNIIVNKEQKTNNYGKQFSFWLFIIFLCGLISLHVPKKNWSLINSNIKLTNFLDNNLSKIQKKENKKKRL